MGDKPKDPNLPRYSVQPNEQRGGWDLKKEGAARATKHFEKKSDATKGGVLSDAIAGGVGSVRIRKEDGTIQEERTFPRARDPKNSPG
jgi:hypothetical protein